MEENVEIVRGAIGVLNAFMRGELSSETVLNVTDPRFEFRWHKGQALPESPQHVQGVPALTEFGSNGEARWPM